jgi:hypothetical protein
MDVEALDHGTTILRDKFGNALELLIASVGLLLLMVCANLAGCRCCTARGERGDLRTLGCGRDARAAGRKTVI